MALGPSIVSWTDHAFDKSQREGWVPTDVEAAVLDQHDRRRANAGDADWLLAAGRLVVAYDWPADGDAIYAPIVTVWRRAG